MPATPPNGPPQLGWPSFAGRGALRLLLTLFCLGALTPLSTASAAPQNGSREEREDQRYRTLRILQPVSGGNAEKAMIAYHRHKADVSVTPSS